MSLPGTPDIKKRLIGGDAGDDRIAGTSFFHCDCPRPTGSSARTRRRRPKDKAVPRLAVGGGCRRRSSFEGDRFIAEKKCPSSAVRRLLRDDDGAGGSTIELRERSGH